MHNSKDCSIFAAQNTCVRIGHACTYVQYRIIKTQNKGLIHMKTRSVLIIFFCLAAIHASAQLFVSQDKRDVAFQGQQSFKSPQTTRLVSNYVGTVYTPFGSEVPSDQSGIGSNNDDGGKPGQIRRGFIIGPDTDPANQSPIGEPWILLAFAALFGGFIAWRKKTVTKTSTKG